MVSTHEAADLPKISSKIATSTTTCSVKGAIFTFILAAIAYHERDNFLSCLDCVTDWQQETRGLFLLAPSNGTRR
jgi:hypothetical protein